MITRRPFPHLNPAAIAVTVLAAFGLCVSVGSLLLH